MKKTTVAIFEDDPTNRFIYERLLNTIGHEMDVFVFDNPDNGIAMCEYVRFDVVFIEIHFWQNFGGVSILKRLKDAGCKDMFAVAMTALLQQGDLERITSSGFGMCLEKPVAFQHIVPLLGKSFSPSN